jgi:hypothetical protein
MILQTDRRLNASINRFGCLFLCFLRTVKEDWLPEEIEKIYKSGLLGENCYVSNHDRLLAFIGSKYRFSSFSIVQPESGVFVERHIEEVGYHFTLNMNGLLYDPLLGSNLQRSTEVDRYTILRRV